MTIALRLAVIITLLSISALVAQQLPIAFSVVGGGRRSKRMAQVTWDAMAPEQQDRVIDAHQARSRERAGLFLFLIAILGGFLLIGAIGEIISPPTSQSSVATQAPSAPTLAQAPTPVSAAPAPAKPSECEDLSALEHVIATQTDMAEPSPVEHGRLCDEIGASRTALLRCVMVGGVPAWQSRNSIGASLKRAYCWRATPKMSERGLRCCTWHKCGFVWQKSA
jgi:hypothetical protein